MWLPDFGQAPKTVQIRSRVKLYGKKYVWTINKTQQINAARRQGMAVSTESKYGGGGNTQKVKSFTRFFLLR